MFCTSPTAALLKAAEQAEAGSAEARVNQRQSTYRKRKAENELASRDIPGHRHVSVSFPIASLMRTRQSDDTLERFFYAFPWQN